jgi:hypothetical protein
MMVKKLEFEWLKQRSEVVKLQQLLSNAGSVGQEPKTKVTDYVIRLQNLLERKIRELFKEKIVKILSCASARVKLLDRNDLY